MNTVIIREREDAFDALLEEAAIALRNGKLAAFPTETVYGLGANAFDDEACKRIYSAKGRPSDNPLIVHVCDMDMAKALVQDCDERFFRLAEAFWPGPISFVLKKNEKVCNTVSAGLDTVAIRMPDHELALSLIRRAGVPIAAPSANLSGRPSPTRSEHVIFDLSGRVDYILCSERFPIGVESTVLDLSTKESVILRPGAINERMILERTGIRVKSQDGAAPVSVPKSPGTKYKHYSPEARVFMVDADFRAEDVPAFAASKGVSASRTKFLEYPNDVRMARDLFADFREADLQHYELVLVKAPDSGDLLEANLNRLKKACES